MYGILLLILLIIPFILFFLLKKNFRNNEIFLQNSIDQLTLEKSILEKVIIEKDNLAQHFELELLKSRQLNLELNEKSEHVAEENEALRNLIEGLQKKQSSKNEDIIIEHIFKP